MGKEGPLQEREPNLRRFKFFGQYNDGVPTRFKGVATLDLSTGQFVGTTTDREEEADIIGEKLQERICFVKLYRGDKRTTQNLHPINYEFEGKGDSLSGFYTFGYKEEWKGSAMLVIEPMGDSLMSAGEFRQFTGEVSKLIAERRREMQERFRMIEESRRQGEKYQPLDND